MHSILYDDATGKAIGVNVIDAITKIQTKYFSNVVFLNAGAINSTAILLNSKSKRYPNGLGNDNGLLGKYFGFHNYRALLSATCPGFEDKVKEGRSPTNEYMPRYVNLNKDKDGFKGAYGVAIYTARYRKQEIKAIGTELVNDLLKDKNYEPWSVVSMMMGETLPKESNSISLDSSRVDQYGIPLIKFNVGYDDNDEKMMEHFYQEWEQIYEKAGFTNVERIDTGQAPGLDIHEMGGARMGKDPKTSILNAYNQVHTVDNLYVSDGACMTSTSYQNPSLTYMALAARAADHYMKRKGL